MARDLKNKFYRTLNLDKESKDILKWYRSVIKSIQNDADKKVMINKEKKQNN
jgi:hypothetical protein